MLGRRRRVIYNNDGGDALFFPADQQVTPQNLIDRWTRPLLGSHVDTVFYCTGHGFGFHTHDTRAGWVLEGYGNHAPYEMPAGQVSAVGPLIDQGHDPMKVIVDFCHAHGIEVFRSQRMNDVHDREWRPDMPHPEFSPFKQRHPECLVGSVDDAPPRIAWTAVDYAHPEVREAMFRYQQEVCRNYDVDGIDMDFTKSGILLKSVAWGGQASRQELDVVTDMVRRVRDMTEREGRRRGRPILVSVRVQDSVEYCRGIGIDLERWLADGLVDILIATNSYVQFNPWHTIVQLGHRHGVKVYPSLQRSIIKGGVPPFDNRNSVEAWRAGAAQILQSGADGVYLFNFLRPEQWWPWLREIGEPETLARVDKDYYATVTSPLRGPDDNISPGYWLAGGNRFANLPILVPDKPLTVKPGSTSDLDIRLGDDLAAVVRDGPQPKATCHMLAADDRHLTVRLNGVPVEQRRQNGVWLEFPIRPEVLRPGANRFEFELADGGGGNWILRDLVVSVRFR